MSNFPLVRISSRKHIEELRSGQLFLRHITYYQRLEENVYLMGVSHIPMMRFYLLLQNTK